VFAIGDVRAGSTKRVAAAVGEGAAIVARVHSELAAISLIGLSGAELAFPLAAGLDVRIGSVAASQRPATVVR
jgi:hypothetical protein